MPASVRRSPFTDQPTSALVPAPRVELLVSHARVLKALAPEAEGDLEINWPIHTAHRLALAVGTSPRSDYVRRALRGLPAGSSSGVEHDGLLALGYVRAIELDIEGHKEVNYKITPAGINALRAHLAQYPLPPMRPRGLCVNNRYRGSDHTC